MLCDRLNARGDSGGEASRSQPRQYHLVQDLAGLLIGKARSHLVVGLDPHLSLIRRDKKNDPAAVASNLPPARQAICVDPHVQAFETVDSDNDESDLRPIENFAESRV